MRKNAHSRSYVLKNYLLKNTFGDHVSSMYCQFLFEISLKFSRHYSPVKRSNGGLPKEVTAACQCCKSYIQSVSWILAEFYFNRGLQRLYTGTCITLQKTINGFLCLIIVFLKSKTYQLILKDVIKLNRNLG